MIREPHDWTGELEVGDDLYCPEEGWSGTIEAIDCDDLGQPIVVTLRNHDPDPEKAFIVADLSELWPARKSRTN